MKKFFQTLSIAAVICAASASNLSAVQLKDGKVEIDATSGKITKPFAIKEIEGVKYIIGVPKGMVEYEIEIMEDGEYVIWGKACGMNGNSDSFLVLIDKMPALIWDIRIYKDKKAKWQKMIGRKKIKDGKVKLTKGKHKLILKGREPNSRLEKIFIAKVGIKPSK